MCVLEHPLADAHTHLHDARLAPTLPALLDAARQHGIGRWTVCGTSPADWPAVSALVGRHPGMSGAYGIHPWYAAAAAGAWRDRLTDCLRADPQAAVGEVGLDATPRGAPAGLQEPLLREQLELAVRECRPVALHAARCLDPLLTLLRPFAHRLPGFLVHAFAGSVEQLRAVERMGGSVSIGGAVLRPDATRLQAVVRAVDPDRILIETDAPDLRPPGGLGCGPDERLNHPANLRAVARQVARLRGMPLAELAALTHANMQRLCATTQDRPAVAATAAE